MNAARTVPSVGPLPTETLTPRDAGLSSHAQVSAQNAKVHRRNQKWRESRRTASESQEWRYLWWTLKPPSAAHAAIPCSSAENAQHRRLAGGARWIRTLGRRKHQVKLCD